MRWRAPRQAESRYCCTASRRGALAVLREVLRDTLVITGALFALLLGATMFTLVVRAFGTDIWIQTALASFSGGAPVVSGRPDRTCAVRARSRRIRYHLRRRAGLAAEVLVQIHDATWVAVLTLLILQASLRCRPSATRC